MNCDKIVYHFFGVNSPPNIVLGEHRYISHLAQVHSARCVELKSCSDIDFNLEADAQITSDPNIVLVIQTADCVPVLLYDRKAKVIGAIHAGWRGALVGIIANTVEKVNALKHENLELEAIIGPCIRQMSYEVDESFFEKFMEKDATSSKFFLKKIGSIQKYFFDLPAYVRELLLRAGVLATYDVGIDTFTADKFFSHRRSIQHNTPAGRNLSVIGIRQS